MVCVWVVTGCSLGLGKEICINALARGDKVIATCRGNAQERLADLIARGADALSLDVTASFHEIQEFARKAIAIHGQVDIVCNNAGYLQRGTFEETNTEETMKQYQTLLFGPLNLTRALLPHMRERKTGMIAMIGSRGADMVLPGFGLYVTCKSALASLAQTLSAEVAPFNIQAVCIDLGDYRTDILATSSSPATRISAYEDIVAPLYEQLGPRYKQPGDLKLGAERIVDLLTGAGHTKGRKIPSRVSLGDDACDTRTKAMEKRIEEAIEWKEWSTGTNVR